MDDQVGPEPDASAPPGKSRAVGIAMVSGAVALVAFVIASARGAAQWHEYVTGVVLLCLAVALAIRGGVILARKGDPST